MSGTHRLTNPSGEVVDRPCNAWCRDHEHAALFHTWPDEHTAESVKTVVERVNPSVEVIGAFRAPEAKPIHPYWQVRDVEMWVVRLRYREEQ